MCEACEAMYNAVEVPGDERISLDLLPWMPLQESWCTTCLSVLGTPCELNVSGQLAGWSLTQYEMEDGGTARDGLTVFNCAFLPAPRYWSWNWSQDNNCRSIFMLQLLETRMKSHHLKVILSNHSLMETLGLLIFYYYLTSRWQFVPRRRMQCTLSWHTDWDSHKLDKEVGVRGRYMYFNVLAILIGFLLPSACLCVLLHSLFSLLQY